MQISIGNVLLASILLGSGCPAPPAPPAPTGPRFGDTRVGGKLDAPQFPLVSGDGKLVAIAYGPDDMQQKAPSLRVMVREVERDAPLEQWVVLAPGEQPSDRELERRIAEVNAWLAHHDWEALDASTSATFVSGSYSVDVSGLSATLHDGKLAVTRSDDGTVVSERDASGWSTLEAPAVRCDAGAPHPYLVAAYTDRRHRVLLLSVAFNPAAGCAPLDNAYHAMLLPSR